MIGVAISTHARPGVLASALTHWAPFIPDVLVVNHDRDAAGVATTKNRGITALMDAGCDHLFLADDDMWPVTPNWAELYVDDPEPHLMHCWGERRLLGDDGHYTRWSWPRGVLLYCERRAIDTVGGMRPDFGRWGGEHAEWSARIHASGLTKQPFADLSAARRGVWHAEDYTRAVPSTVTGAQRRVALHRGPALHKRFAGTTDFVQYRPMENGQ